jgi:hypothetical protein
VIAIRGPEQDTQTDEKADRRLEAALLHALAQPNSEEVTSWEW